MIVYGFLLASSGKGEKMSYLKRICVWILSMSLIIASGCMKKELILETGESIVHETEVLLETELETSSQKEDSKALIYVYVCGYVKCPGVYGLNNGDRIYQAIEMAGGAALEADLSSLNLASVLSDGQKIYVPSYEEMKARTADKTYLSDETSGTDSGYDGFQGDADCVNINQASKEQLMTLPGIGSSKAEAILEYRQEYGAFSSTEDLMEVPGIKEGTYSQIKDRISIN